MKISTAEKQVEGQEICELTCRFSKKFSWISYVLSVLSILGTCNLSTQIKYLYTSLSMKKYKFPVN